MNRRTWIASLGATLFLTRLRTGPTLFHTVGGAALSVDFGNDAVWSDLVTEAFATTARTAPFHPDVTAEPER